QTHTHTHKHHFTNKHIHIHTHSHTHTHTHTHTHHYTHTHTHTHTYNHTHTHTHTHTNIILQTHTHTHTHRLADPSASTFIGVYSFSRYPLLPKATFSTVEENSCAHHNNLFYVYKKKYCIQSFTLCFYSPGAEFCPFHI